jgi:hypothetical protein
MPDTLPNLAEIDERIAAASENLRELVEQAAAYSGAADEDLMSQRIAEQEALLERLTKQRDELSQTEPQIGARRNEMSVSQIKAHMEVIGADGVHIGTVDSVENGRIKLAKADSGEGRHKGHHHFVDLGLVADVRGRRWLSAVAAVAVTLEEERSGDPT